MSNTGATPVSNVPVFQDCVVQLTGEDGNAFAILCRVKKKMAEHLRETNSKSDEVKQAIINTFMIEATAADYEHLLHVCQAWVTIE
jgi:hypothetical protein